jgi:lipopolysaccharide export LptBFGC system permease protein LptF
MTRSRPFTLIASLIFAIMALLHIYRLFTHFQVVLGSHEIPMTVSYLAIVVAAILAWGCYRESRS